MNRLITMDRKRFTRKGRQAVLLFSTMLMFTGTVMVPGGAVFATAANESVDVDGFEADGPAAEEPAASEAGASANTNTSTSTSTNTSTASDTAEHSETANQAAPAAPASSSGSSTARKSADNSLASLSLSAGNLSPEFKYNTTSYTVDVDNSVTSVNVSAKTSNSRAVIESVSGGKTLEVGENRITIVVRAENGATATYTIRVNRKADGAAVEDPEAADPDDAADENETDPQDAPAVEGIERSKLVELFPGIESRIEGIDDVFVIRSAASYLVVLPDAGMTPPAGYVKSTMRLDLSVMNQDDSLAFYSGDSGMIDVWWQEDVQDGLPLVYGVNQMGVYSYYLFDTNEISYVTFVEQERVSMEPEPAAEDTQAAPEQATQKEEGEQVTETHGKNILLGVAVIAVLVILIVVLLLVLLGHGGGRGGSDDDDDLEFLNL